MVVTGISRSTVGILFLRLFGFLFKGMTVSLSQNLALSGDCPFQGSPEALYIFPYAANCCASF
jgi:hypothetical protein